MVDGKGVDNWVMVDFPYVMQQLGVDPFDGHGWERFDSHRRALRTGERDEGEHPLAKEGDR